MSLLTRTATVIAEELSTGAWLVAADGMGGLWYACSDSLAQATSDATYGAMIGEEPDRAGACAQDGAALETYNAETGEYGTTRDARMWVIARARELRAQG